MTLTTSKTHIAVRTAEREDGTLVAGVLTESFFDDPVTCWLVPSRGRRPSVLPLVFELYFDLFVGHHETYISGDGAGVALWLPPGVEMVREDQLEEFGRRVREAAGSDAARVLELGEFFDVHAPAKPHWHLLLLGTLPERQGQGIGSALLSDFLPGADRRGEPIYLEATTRRSRALYERHGFVCQGEIVLPDGPTLFQMWRSPR